jgi:hypothetical protein
VFVYHRVCPLVVLLPAASFCASGGQPACLAAPFGAYDDGLCPAVLLIYYIKNSEKSIPALLRAQPEGGVDALQLRESQIFTKF